ncbi:hypothetical protein NCC49_004828 [Naganishia albida]|nr:hypothetical protein NCC49_004828 [Naganishia albida]
MKHIKLTDEQGPIAEALLSKLPEEQADALRYMSLLGELDRYEINMDLPEAAAALRRRRRRLARKVPKAYRKRIRQEDQEGFRDEPFCAGGGGVKKPPLSS